MKSQNPFLTESECERTQDPNIQTFPKVRTLTSVLGTVQTCSDQSDYIARGERSRTAKNARKLHSDGPHRFLGRLLAFSVFVAQGKQSATRHALYSNTRSSSPKARSTPGVHSQTEICDEKYWKVRSVLDSDVTGCLVSIVSSIKPKQLGQSAASSKCRNHGQGGGNRQLLAIRWERTSTHPMSGCWSYPPVIKNGDGRSPKKTELWLAGNILGFYINMGDFPKSHGADDTRQ